MFEENTLSTTTLSDDHSYLISLDLKVEAVQDLLFIE
jgi:hypothetical protein